MSNASLTFSISVDVEPPMSADAFFNIFNQLWTAGAGRYIKRTIIISHTADTAIDLGDIVTLGYFAYYNSDPVNYLKIKTGNAGTAFARPGPGRAGLFELEPGLTPYAIADTADCALEYAIFTR